MNQEKLDSLIINVQELICYIADVESYELLYMTATGMRAYGMRSVEEYKGKKCYELLQGLDAPCPFCTNSRLTKGKKFIWEHFNEKIKRWVRIEDCLIELDGKKCRVEVARDITQQKEELALLTSKLSTEAALVECVKALSHESDMDRAVNRFLNIVGNFYAAKRAYIFEFDFENQVMNNTFEWCAEGVTTAIGKLQQIPMRHAAHWIRKFETTGRFFISSLYEDLDETREDFKILKAQNIESLMSVALKKDGKVIGFLGVDDPSLNLDNWTLLDSAVTFILQELEKRRLILQLEYSSYTDTLTALKNRNCFNRTVEQSQKALTGGFAVFYLDLDKLKEINDTLGHAVGDANLIAVANVLRQVFAEHDIFRTGGDEFVVFMSECDEHLVTAKKSELTEALKGFDIPCSCGVCFSTKRRFLSEMILEAEKQMYADKRHHHGQSDKIAETKTTLSEP